MKSRLFNCLFFLCILYSVKSYGINLIDNEATQMTRNLFNNLSTISKENIIFGHQYATTYGHWGVYDESGFSDVKDVIGTHPGVIGADFREYTLAKGTDVIKEKNRLLKLIKETYKRGGVVSISWHCPNPVNYGSYNYKENPIKAVPYILPGGEYHSVYKMFLDRIAEFAKDALNEDGECIPFIFRPFHEMCGDWFWWGKANCNKEDFISLWKFTVDYLKDEKNVHSIIYAFSPDRFYESREEYLERYPGDSYVDLLGVDNYWDIKPEKKHYKPELAIKKLRIISDLAKQKGKLAAFTETGYAGIPVKDWFTKNLLPVLKCKGVNLSYVLVWRNAIGDSEHFHAPYRGHHSVEDFKKFYRDEKIWFEEDLKKNNIYEKH